MNWTLALQVLNHKLVGCNVLHSSRAAILFLSSCSIFFCLGSLFSISYLLLHTILTSWLLVWLCCFLVSLPWLTAKVTMLEYSDTVVLRNQSKGDFALLDFILQWESSLTWAFCNFQLFKVPWFGYKCTLQEAKIRDLYAVLTCK